MLCADEAKEREDEAAFKRLAVGDGVDAKDSFTGDAGPQWYHAKIVDKHEGLVQVNFEGFNAKWDE